MRSTTGRPFITLPFGEVCAFMARLFPEDPTVAVPCGLQRAGRPGRRAAGPTPLGRAAFTVTHQAIVTPPDTVRPAPDTIFLSPDGGFATLSDRARSTTDPATARLAVLAPAARLLRPRT